MVGVSDGVRRHQLGTSQPHDFGLFRSSVTRERRKNVSEKGQLLSGRRYQNVSDGRCRRAARGGRRKPSSRENTDALDRSERAEREELALRKKWSAGRASDCVAPPLGQGVRDDPAARGSRAGRRYRIAARGPKTVGRIA